MTNKDITAKLGSPDGRVDTENDSDVCTRIMTDEKVIELVGQYAACYAYKVDVLGNYAYVAVGSGFVEEDGLYVIDVFDPSNPVKVGQYNMGTRALGVAVSGNYAYMACDDGLYIIDVSDPPNPVKVGQYTTDSYAFNVDVSGNFAYVAGYSDGLYIIDVSDPSNPVKVGQYNTGTYAEDVVISGDYAYATDYFSGLHIIDVSDPSNPVKVGQYIMGRGATGVAVSGNYAYVGDGPYGLYIIDVSNPSNPVKVEQYVSSMTSLSVTVSNGYVYWANGGGLYIYKIVAEEPTDNRYALIEGMPGRLFENPANWINNLLVEGYGYKNVELKTSADQLTYLEILANIDDLIENTAEGENKLFYYHAGHGHHSLLGGREGIEASDVGWGGIPNIVWDNDLADKFNEVKNVGIIFDSCHSGRLCAETDSDCWICEKGGIKGDGKDVLTLTPNE